MNVPIKLDTGPSSESVKNSDMYVFVPSWVRYNWTKLISSVVGSWTSTEAKYASVTPVLLEIISDVEAVATIALLPVKLMKPIDCVPIPARLLLNDDLNIFRS